MSRAAERYEAKRREHGEALASVRGRSRSLSLARLVVAASSLVALAAAVWGPTRSLAGFTFLALVAAFIGLLRAHDRVLREERRHELGEGYAAWGLRRLDGSWGGDGNQTVTAAVDHPFARDLDIEGGRSLLAFVDTTGTAGGRALLTSRLLATKNPPFEVLRSWQAAVRDLATRHDLRERLYLRGNEAKADPKKMIAWAEGAGLAAPPSARMLALLFPVATITLMVIAERIGGISYAIGALVVQIVVARALVPRAGLFVSELTSGERGIAPYGELMAAVEESSFESKELNVLKARLLEGGASSAAVAKLGRIVSYAEARENEVFRYFIGPIFLFDVHAAFALEAWRKAYGARLRGALEALSEVDALSALGTFSFDHEELSFPSFSEDAFLEADGLGHPLIHAKKRVTNDVPRLDGGSALVVTGSNMSGKSTMLRSIGTNAVLAYAGAPVVATTMSLGPARVMTSMQIADSLDEGVSHFLAELLRLKGILTQAKEDGPVLFLLDEILHGTNHRERLIGGKLVIRELMGSGALGLVSTHDLGVGELEQETGGRAKNVHFEEQVANGVMTFDYRMRDGLVASSNALRLMADLGLVPKSALET